MSERLSEDDRALIKKLLWEVEEALQVLEEVSAKPEPSRSDVYAASTRYRRSLKRSPPSPQG
jgi:hypothetical protein